MEAVGFGLVDQDGVGGCVRVRFGVRECPDVRGC
jgi:hypothetical protein